MTAKFKGQLGSLMSNIAPTQVQSARLHQAATRGA